MIYVIIWILCGLAAAAVYSGKGGSPVSGFLIGILLGPIGLIIALISGSQLPKCPYCAERIQRDAKVCPHCRKELPDPNIIIVG